MQNSQVDDGKKQSNNPQDSDDSMNLNNSREIQKKKLASAANTATPGRFSLVTKSRGLFDLRPTGNMKLGPTNSIPTTNPLDLKNVMQDDQDDNDGEDVDMEFLKKQNKKSLTTEENI